jgi:hypothetical protein
MLLLGGCPPTPVTLKTITLYPSGLNWSSWEKDNTNAWCSIPLPGQGLFTQGLGPEPVGPGQVDVGYEDIYESGSGPLACTYQQQRQYRAQVAFDLSQFDAVVSATLTFNIDLSLSEDGGIQQDAPPNSYGTTLGMSTGTIDIGDGPFFWPYDNDVAFSCTFLFAKPDCSVDATSQVNQWANKSHANSGFIIAGPVLNFPGNLPSDNNGQVSWYSHFQLQVTYNPTANKRAPQ